MKVLLFVIAPKIIERQTVQSVVAHPRQDLSHTQHNGFCLPQILKTLFGLVHLQETHSLLIKK